ncbi:MAG: hypothetical protein QGG73_02380 [Candidatus Hydrogenedentes bacterium]|nr:hypothetical protein [Candidatus Hydrogenedentota bacterium]
MADVEGVAPKDLVGQTEVALQYEVDGEERGYEEGRQLPDSVQVAHVTMDLLCLDGGAATGSWTSVVNR